MLWLWFGAVMVLAIFFTEKPRTHVYTFFMPWLLIAGQVLAAGWFWLRRQIGFGAAVTVGAVFALFAILVFGNYAYAVLLEAAMKSCSTTLRSGRTATG